MGKSIEDTILEEIERHKKDDLNSRLHYFNEICTRLGLPKDGLSQIAPRVEEIFKQESKDNPYH